MLDRYHYENEMQLMRHLVHHRQYVHNLQKTKQYVFEFFLYVTNDFSGNGHFAPPAHYDLRTQEKRKDVRN
jgi:hypothetical protein